MIEREFVIEILQGRDRKKKDTKRKIKSVEETERYCQRERERHCQRERERKIIKKEVQFSVYISEIKKN